VKLGKHSGWLAIGAVLALGVAALAQQPIRVGAAAPAWNGTTVAGKAIRSSQYRGKVVLLNFFSRY